MNKMRKRNIIEKPLSKHKWRKENKFYHNDASKHFYYGVARKNDSIAGHDMTSHPTLKKKDGTPKKKFVKLSRNPDPNDNKPSFINRTLRVVNEHYEDTGNRRLKPRKKWKMHRRDMKKIQKIDKKKSAHLNLG